MPRTQKLLVSAVFTFLAVLLQLPAIETEVRRPTEQPTPTTVKPAAADQVTPLGIQRDQTTEMIQARLDKTVAEKSLDLRKEMESTIFSVLKEHREYLQKLDDKLYERFSFWFPSITVICGLGVWAITYYFGNTKKETIEQFKSEAREIFTSEARKKLEETLRPDSLRREFQDWIEGFKAESLSKIARNQRCQRSLSEG